MMVERQLHTEEKVVHNVDFYNICKNHRNQRKSSFFTVSPYVSILFFTAYDIVLICSHLNNVIFQNLDKIRTILSLILISVEKKSKKLQKI